MRWFMVVFSILMVSSVSLAAADSSSLEARRQALRDLLAEQWEYTLRTSPEFASILGDKRYNHRLADLSLAEIERDLGHAREFLQRFEAIDPSGFPEQEKLSHRLMIRNLRIQLEDARWKNWEMPVNQMGGLHLDFPQLIALLAFDTEKDYEDFDARLKQFPVQMEQTIEHMRAGMRDGLMPPRILLEKVAAQAENLAGQKPEESPFAQPLSRFPKSISEAGQKRLREQYLATIRGSVLPAYARFARFVKEEYAPQGRSEPGMWSLPEGAARYATSARRNTTTEMAPEEIHQLGLREVARIEVEQVAIARRLGFQDLKSFRASLLGNRALYARSRQHILDLYQKYTAQMEKELPRLFGRLPKAGLKVLPIEEFQEKEAAGAHYNQGTPDGTRPGYVMVNTGEAESRTTISMESTAYHEGYPGHHLQIAIGQELEELPAFRQQGGYNAFVEGWALYSERLGKEVGFYQDPYNDYGRLEDEMLRAIRLVVDTGFHYKQWTREQVVQFFHDHSAIDEVSVQSETDRYIAIPGQALGYKIGQLKFLELRERARQELGSRFDLRRFHDLVLGAGALPLEVLEERVASWITAEKAAKGGVSAVPR